ncbi:MAG: DnaD domain protein [Anaerolineales bacterium]|nr:DnaD domain protein [Anaerolineales bacterium]
MKTPVPTDTFPGFERRSSVTPIPEKFFTLLLPQIDHLGELKVTLYAFWAMAQQQIQYPYLCRRNMLTDEILLQSLVQPGEDSIAALDDALHRAVKRGTLLHSITDHKTGKDDYYFINSTRGQQAVDAIENGTWQPAFEPQPSLPTSQRLNIFLLYEQNIGPLTPMIAERLKDAEQEYPAQWVEEAFQIAVDNNVRKWSYIEAILKDWQDRGKNGREHHRRTQKTEQDYRKGWFDE